MNIFYENIFGVNIAYHRTGQGSPMVFVHGITTNSFIWKNLLPAVSKKFELITVDLIGAGKSEKPSDVDYSLKNQAEFIRELIRKLNLRKVNFIGHDVGGGIAQILAVNYPALFRRAVLINSVAYDFWPVQPIIAMRTPIIRQIALASLDVGMLKIIVRRGLYHKEKLDNELLGLFWEQMSNREGRKAFLRFAKALNNRDLMSIEEKIKLIDFPVMIIRGDEDVYLSREISVQLHKNIRNSKLEIIENAGHYAMIDEPEKIASLINNFCADDL